jgi:membrane associated rhomboid family serine protease
MPDKDALAALNAAQAELDQAYGAAGATQPWSPELVEHLSFAILAFSCVALILTTALLWRKAQHASALNILKIFGIISIIGVSALLLVAGYTRDQLTPIVGLFGAIAGYLLGKESPASPTEE